MSTETTGKVLIVEDSRTERLILQKMVTQGGYELLVAEDGVKGLELAITQKPDVILSDILMPRLTGIEMCRMLKARDDTRHIPVIFLSGMDDMEQVVQGLEAGASDYLSKHIDSHRQVIQTVEVNLRSSYLQRTGKVLPESGGSDDLSSNLFLGMELFDLVSCGVVVFSLRKVPVYANRVGRRQLGLAEEGDLSSIEPDRFEPLIQAGVSSYFKNDSEFFHEVTVLGRTYRMRMEEAQRPGAGISGLLFFLEPELQAARPAVAPMATASGEEEPMLPE